MSSSSASANRSFYALRRRYCLNVAYKLKPSTKKEASSLIRFAPSALVPAFAAGDANSNVVLLALGTLPQLRSASQLMTGDAIVCRNAACAAAMSKWTKRIGDKWICDFCKQANVAELEEPEIPKQPSLDYVLEPSKAPIGAVIADDTYVVFCIDMSGSMCVTTEYEGSLDTEPTVKTKEDSARLNPEKSNQRLPSEKRNISYISRLAALQTALKGQIDSMAKQYPHRKIAVITFSSEVEIIGDASIDPVHLAGDQLNNFEAVASAGEAYPLKLAVQQSKDRLWAKIKALEEGGATALGPALAAAVAMAGKRAGSRVVICTDGLANVGLGFHLSPGSLDELKSDAERANAEGFYRRVATIAKEKGVSVSVLSIAGTECRLENLGMVADVTGGAVNLVSPIDMAKNFSEVLADQVGTQLVNRHKIDLGNLTSASEHPMVLQPNAECAKGEVKEAVMQVQVAYRQLDGALRLHIATTSLPVTLNKEQAEANLDVQVIGTYVSKACAQLVQDGKYKEVRQISETYGRLLARACKSPEQQSLLRNYHVEMKSAEEALQRAERHEELEGLLIDNELDENAAMRRGRVRLDETAEKMYAMKSSKAANCVVQ